MPELPYNLPSSNFGTLLNHFCLDFCFSDNLTFLFCRWHSFAEPCHGFLQMSFFHRSIRKKGGSLADFLQEFRIITLNGNQDGLLISPRNRLYILVSPSLVDKFQFPRQYVYHSYHQSDETSSFLMFTSWLLMVELNCYCWCLDMLKHHHVDDWNQCLWWLNCCAWMGKPARPRQDAAEGKHAATLGCARQGPTSDVAAMLMCTALHFVSLGRGGLYTLNFLRFTF